MLGWPPLVKTVAVYTAYLSFCLKLLVKVNVNFGQHVAITLPHPKDCFFAANK